MTFKNKTIICTITLLITLTAPNKGEQTRNSSNILEAYETKDYSDQNIYFLKNKHIEQKKNHDTIGSISTLSMLGYIYSHHANYAKAYENYWEALLLADKTDDRRSTAKLHEQIAWLYSFFNRKDESLDYYLLALNETKELIKLGLSTQLISNYYGLTTYYREINNINTSKAYLDSCFMLHYAKGGINNAYYLQAEQAYNLLLTGNTQQAIINMSQQEAWFLKNNASYLTILYSFLGDAYKKQLNYKQSEIYYLASIQKSIDHKSHVNYRPLVYEKLSDLYQKNNDYKNAYAYLLEAKTLNELLYDSRSLNNNALLEISDEFRKEKEVQNKLIHEQQYEALKHEEKILALQKTILILLIISGLLIAYFYFRFIKSKHKSTQLLTIKTKELENLKNKELLNLKNKELAASALRIIEKDEVLKTIKTAMTDNKEKLSEGAVKNLFKSITNTNSNNWKEFEARFISVNPSFYQTLNNKHPHLTQGDKKLCALIKLNFNSKEIAQLLGISVESIHTLRYRLRKKMNLSRSTNLTNYLEKII